MKGTIDEIERLIRKRGGRDITPLTKEETLKRLDEAGNITFSASQVKRLIEGINDDNRKPLTIRMQLEEAASSPGEYFTLYYLNDRDVLESCIVAVVN